MPICQNCGYTWSYAETLKRSFTLTSYMRCPNCEAAQFQTAKSRRSTALLTATSIVLIMGFTILFDPTLYSFALFCIALVLMITTYPRLIKLSKAEEHLF
ncbi:TIGR04104 family putative zinc finger protein [Chryseomicrobium palamuruense]|uniref:TIGR04104 family putative zinc finger protein n=1 Tax=Chryseomicrobium palamuruense TaxID=682973 RepID=A0ABV8UY82_9BACL